LSGIAPVVGHDVVGHALEGAGHRHVVVGIRRYGVQLHVRARHQLRHSAQTAQACHDPENLPRLLLARYTWSMRQPQEILEAALKLDPSERAAIASEILESLEESAYGQLSPAWEDEIQRRLRDVEAGRADLVPADRVFAEVEAELQARRAPR
jgi:putative addiction module component (TIGR02574 family)